MTKKYHSKSCVSLSVPIKDGICAHISFDSLTGGGSVFYTDDEELQEALEKHHMYGKLFKEEIIPAATTAPAKSKKKAKGSEVGKVNSEESDSTEETEDGNDGSTLKEVRVTDLEDARNYLADTFGVSRTKIRLQKDIEAFAESKGVKFVGI